MSEKHIMAETKQSDKRLEQYLANHYQAVNPMPDLEPAADDLDGVWSRINFSMKPEELVQYLDQYIVRQDKAKQVLATKICTHLNRARYLAGRENLDAADGVGLIKNNILMIGPTGVGKTYLVKLIAAKLGVPFVKGDATKFSETGYVGGDVEDLVRDLVHEAGDDLELAQYGIIYIDEIDKIAGHPSLMGPDVSRTGVQRALLKPMEETQVDLKVPHDPISQIQAVEEYRRTGKREKKTLNTRHILFIMSGAFTGLAEVIKQRINAKSVGFAADVRPAAEDFEYFSQASSQDLTNFGFETEFIGRLPVTVVLENLSADDLFNILHNPNNPVIISKKRDFAAYGIELRFEEQALRCLAAEAASLGTGARALVSVLEKALLPFESKLPSTNIRRLLVTPELVADPENYLQRILDLEQPNDFEAPRYAQAGQAERLELLKMIGRRESLYQDRLESPLTPARLDLIADEYYRAGLSLGAAFENVLQRLAMVRRFEAAFKERSGLTIRFAETAEVAILAGAATEKRRVQEFLHSLGTLLEPGLKLVESRIGQTQFLLPAEAVWNTEDYLRDLFAKHYQAALND